MFRLIWSDDYTMYCYKTSHKFDFLHRLNIHMQFFMAFISFRCNVLLLKQNDHINTLTV